MVYEILFSNLKEQDIDKRYNINEAQKHYARWKKAFRWGSAGKESGCNAGDLSTIPGLGRSPGEGKGNPLQYSGLENFMDSVVHGVSKSRTWLSDFKHHQVKESRTVSILCDCLYGISGKENFIEIVQNQWLAGASNQNAWCYLKVFQNSHSKWLVITLLNPDQNLSCPLACF